MKLMRNIYGGIMRQLIKRSATHSIAVSECAAAGQPANTTIIPCGIDPAPFRRPIKLQDNGRLIVGHVGRFVPEKNHDFFLKVAAEILRHEPTAGFIFIGDGPLKSSVQQRAEELGIAKSVIFAGLSDDVPEKLMRVFDVFLFPSKSEGLGIAVLEAQAAGLPCVISSNLPEEVEVIPELVSRVSLDESPERWAAHVLTMRFERDKPRIDDPRFKPYLIENSAKRLTAVYDNA